MKNHLLSVLLCLSSLTAMVGEASAGPLVAANSEYTIYLAGAGNSAPVNPTAIFDASPTVFSLDRGVDELTVTITENEEVIGVGMSIISINVSANGDLFPSALEFDPALLGLGVFGNGLDFNFPVFVSNARILFYVGTELFGISDDFVAQLGMNDPWDGTAPTVGSAFGFDFGAQGVTGFTFEFTVAVEGAGQAVPEPGSLLLGGIGLTALAAIRRRRMVVPG